jgi:hypothetical protein
LEARMPVSIHEHQDMVLRLRNRVITSVTQGRQTARLLSLIPNWIDLLSDGEDEEVETNADSDDDYAMDGLSELKMWRLLETIMSGSVALHDMKNQLNLASLIQFQPRFGALSR